MSRESERLERASSTGTAERAGSGGFLRGPVWLAAVGTWAYLLYGFVSTPPLIVLSLLGASLVLGGLYLSLASIRYVDESPWYLGAFVAGLLMLVGAAATLAAAAPGRLLASSASGWGLLDKRAGRLEDAIQDVDVALAGRLAGRGLGDDSPLGPDGRPLIHDAKDVRVLGALLDGGLDPDARDTEGRTLLMNTWDAEIARALLAAGADPNARSRGGSTVLSASRDRDPELVALLLEAGAVESDTAVAAGRTDWLATDDVHPDAGGSAVTLDRGSLRRGEVATLDVRIVNGSDEDRRLVVEAALNGAALFVGASHDGAVANPRQPQLQQTIRWPPLALPAGSRGRLALQIVVGSDEAPGDLSVDVRVRRVPGYQEEVLQLYESLPGSERHAEGGDGVWLAGLTVALALGLLLVLRRREAPVREGGAPAAAARSRARALAGMSAGLCAGLTIVLVGSAIEPYLRFDDATCTVLDRRIQVRTTRSGTSSRGRLGSAGSRYTVPLAAVRIDAGAETSVATGFATGPATHFVQELRSYPLGATVPCWVDPEDRLRFTLVRRPSAAGVVGFGMLSLVTLGLAIIARRLR